MADTDIKNTNTINNSTVNNGKVIPLQARCGPRVWVGV